MTEDITPTGAPAEPAATEPDQDWERRCSACGTDLAQAVVDLDKSTCTVRLALPEPDEEEATAVVSSRCKPRWPTRAPGMSPSTPTITATRAPAMSCRAWSRFKRSMVLSFGS